MELENDSVSFTDFRQTLTISSTSSVHAGEYTAEVSASASVTFQAWEFSELHLASKLLFIRTSRYALFTSDYKRTSLRSECSVFDHFSNVPAGTEQEMCPTISKSFCTNIVYGKMLWKA